MRTCSKESKLDWGVAATTTVFDAKMFRGILPKRAATPEFTMVTPGELFPNGGKENNPAKQPRSNRAVCISKDKLEEVGMDQAFNEMLVGAL
jgi:hypothetical protein